jgi:hypothetical protein
MSNPEKVFGVNKIPSAISSTLKYFFGITRIARGLLEFCGILLDEELPCNN